MWTSVEVYSCYTECVGLVLSRQGLVAKLAFEFRNDLVILSPGLVNILVFRTHIADILKFCEDDKENSQDVNKVTKCIQKKIKDRPIVKGGSYAKRINKSSASEHINDSLKALLRDI